MAKLVQPFDATQFNPVQGVGGLPIGKHLVMIVSDELKATANDKNAAFLQFNLKVVEGPHANAMGVDRLNIYHSSPQTVEIAQKRLSSYSYAIGVFQFDDTAALHNKPFIVEVGPQKDKPEYTEVKKVYDANGNEPGKPAQQQAAQPQTQAPVQQQNTAPAPGYDQAAQPGAAGWQQAPPVQQPAQQPAVQPPVQEQAPVAGWQQAPAQGGVAPAPGAAPAPAGDKPAWAQS